MHYKHVNLSIYRLSNVEMLPPPPPPKKKEEKKGGKKEGKKKRKKKKKKKKKEKERSGNRLSKGHNHNLIIEYRKDVRVMSPIYMSETTDENVQ